MPMNHRPSSPAARISSSGGGSFFSIVSLTRLQYGLSSTVKPWLPHQTTSPLLTTKLARPALTSLTISRATQSPPCSRNIVRCTPGRSLTSSTEASVTQPLSTVSVITSVLVMNGITTWISSLVSGSKIIFTSRFTTSSATRSGMTRPNISTKSFTRSGWPAFSGRYIIGRVSPTAAKEKPPCAEAVSARAGLARSGADNAGNAARAESKVRRSTPAEAANGMFVSFRSLKMLISFGTVRLQVPVILAPLVAGQAAGGDAGDLAGSVEAEQQARRIAAREDEFQDGESLISILLGLHDFGPKRRGSVAVEVVRYARHRLVGHLRRKGGRILRAVGPASHHLGEPAYCPRRSGRIRSLPGGLRLVGAGFGHRTGRKHGDQ